MIPSGKRLHNYGKSPCYSWVNPRTFYGHFQVRKLLVITRPGKFPYISHINPIKNPYKYTDNSKFLLLVQSPEDNQVYFHQLRFLFDDPPRKGII